MTITSVPVLIYHHVNPHRGDTVTLTPEDFAAQMAYLAQMRVRTLTLDELMAFRDGILPLHERSVVLTFDDGWLDNYLHAWPVLRQHLLHATFFLVTDRVEKASRGGIPPTLPVPIHGEAKRLLEREDGGGVALTWQRVAEMERSGLCRFYSHTRSHRPCDALGSRELADELTGSRQLMETRLGRPCDYLCWPYGKFSPAAEAAARNAGYRALFTTEERAVHVGTDPYRMPRIEAVAGVSWLKKLLFP